MNVPPTLQVVAPNWADRLENEDLESLRHEKSTVDGNYLNISMYYTCVVGEAWGFSAKYVCGICQSCVQFADEIDDYVYDNKEEKLEREINMFSYHFETEHAQLVEAAIQRGTIKK